MFGSNSFANLIVDRDADPSENDTAFSGRTFTALQWPTVCVVLGGGVQCLLLFSTLLSLSYDGKKALLLRYKLIMTKVEAKLNSHQSCKRLHHFIGTKEMSPQLISQTSKLSLYKTCFSWREAHTARKWVL